MPTPFLVKALQGIANQNIASVQQQQTSQLAYQTWVNQQQFQVDLQKKQELDLIDSMAPAVQQQAGYLIQQGNHDAANALLNNFKFIRQAGLRGFEVQQAISPKQEEETGEIKEVEGQLFRVSKKIGGPVEQIPIGEQPSTRGFTDKISIADPQTGKEVWHSYNPKTQTLGKPIGLKEPSKGLAGESAGKLASAKLSLTELKTIEDFYFPIDPETKKGKFSRKNTAKTSLLDIPLVKGIAKPFVGGKALKAKSNITDILSNKLRIETGVAARPDELANIVERFQPSVFDTEESAKDKIDRLKEFFNNAHFIIDPTGKFQVVDNKTNKPYTDEPKAEQHIFNITRKK